MPDSGRLPSWLLTGFGFLGLIALTSIEAPAQAAASASSKLAEHCSLAQWNPYDDTVGCLVWDRKPFGDPESRQIEIYRKGELRLTLEPGDPIREWHFWQSGRRMAVSFGAIGAPGRYALYDLESGTQVDGTGPETPLPQWAKSPPQLQDESVPEGASYKRERELWVAKVLRGLDGVRVGMRRKDLVSLLAEECGLSTRMERTYVSVECPFIKLDVKFRMVGDGVAESPEDLVVGVSKAYLAWSVMD